MRKILILGDSLPHSRIHKGQKLEVSWPYLLAKKNNFYVMNIAVGGSTSYDTIKRINSILGYYSNSGNIKQFDAVVLQLGIVDCTPRLTKFLSFFVKVMGKNINRKCLPYLPKKPWVSMRDFEKNLDIIYKKSIEMTHNFLFIPIFYAEKNFKKNIPEVNGYIYKYNTIIKNKAKKEGFYLIDISYHSPYEDLLLDDGHHLSSIAHSLIALEIANKINLNN